MSFSPKEASSIIKLKPYDVIISNNEFEGLSGLEFLEEIRSSGNATPFILLVKKKSEAVYSKAFSLGVDDIIVREDNPNITCLEVNNAINKIINFSIEVQRRITDAINIEDSVPKITPIVITRAKLNIVEPPKITKAKRAKIVVADVIVVLERV